MRIFVLGFCLFVLGACQSEKDSQETNPSEATETAIMAQGEALYLEHCATCHADPDIRAPALSAIKFMGNGAILSTLTDGKMSAQAAHLSAEEKSILAQYLSGQTGQADDWETAMMCEAPQSVRPAETPLVSGWGLGVSNLRYQNDAQAGLRAADLPNLELVWAQAFPGVTEMRSQPVLTSDTLFVGPSTTNSIYAFDLESGCLKWRYDGAAAIRSALALGTLPETDEAFIYYGDVSGHVHAVRAADGTQIWTHNLGDAFADDNIPGGVIITGTPVQHDKRIYIPGSSFEVAMARDPDYECCTKHGLVRAIDATNGDEIWTYHTTPTATLQGESSAGTPHWGPAGAPVWTTPAIDEQRGVLYVGTGENYSLPTTKTSDAIIALDLDTGAETWVFQATENDAYNLACNSWNGGKDGPNCPENPGPDFDFGASVIIAKDAGGKDILLAGQKSGDVWALDPDAKGAVIWNNRLSGGTPVGGIHWGMSVVEQRLFVPIADPEWSISGWDYEPLAGLAALDISTGETLWRYKSRRGCFVNLSEIDMSSGSPLVPWPDCPLYYGHSGAALGLDDIVFAGTLNGKLQAFNPETGVVIWEYDTKQPYDTLNGVVGHGGSLDNSGSVAVGNGYLIVQSGYSYINQMPGNVVLVFRKKTG